jgi:hypothetical protein
MIVLARLARGPRPALLVGLGLLAGLAYSIDLGVGPPLLVCLACWLLWRFRALRPLVLVGLGVLPFFALHHAVNYATGGTWKPANAVPEYLEFPGSAFSAANMTGSWQHANPVKLVLYLLGLLVGKKGFLGHNLPLLLCLPGVGWLVRRRVAEAPEVLFAVGWMGLTWLLYGVASNNSSGVCCSVRWFVPLLAPGFYLLALVLRERPEQGVVFLLLSAGGLGLSAWMMVEGPWTGRVAPHLWATLAVALLAWLWLARRGEVIATDTIARGPRQIPLAT